MSQLCTTGRTANAATPRTKTVAANRKPLPLTVRQTMASVVTPSPPNTTGQRPTRSDQAPATGPPIMPPTCSNIRMVPIHTGPKFSTSAR